MADVDMSDAAGVDWSARVASTRATVEEMLRARRGVEALGEALRDPPYSASEDVKHEAAQTVVRALSAFREAEIKAAVASLGGEEQDALMKYLYKLWAANLPSRTNAQLFVWHAALMELQAGPGSIVRALYDQQCV
eukprot:TRINITY_DN15836_c0_g1_i1.p1 TRINITY_DN15836_c0_g1~~TRINITY_DN15836_c0_g1_i1.p1  ORF type:complete len:152 (-),score=34.72 TRINITY_DN15836_c0_g1_i1:111-518(-)